MAQATDPVCGMTVDTTTAAGTADYQGRTYYFCSDQCTRQFNVSPERFVGRGGTETRREGGAEAR